MASLKFPDISVSALEAGRAMKKLSEAMAKVRETTRDLIFIVQITCTFSSWIYYTPSSLKSIPEYTFKNSYSFSSKTPREQIKEEILRAEELLIKTYETTIKETYGVKYDRTIRRVMEYELEVQKIII